MKRRDGLSKLRDQIMRVDFLLIAICIAFLAASADAATVQNFSTKGVGVQGVWNQQIDPCPVSTVTVDADQIDQGGGQTTYFVEVSTMTLDTCGAGTFSFTDGNSQNAQLSNAGARSAALTASVPTSGCTFDGTSFVYCADHLVDINLSWTAAGPALRTNFVTRTQGVDGMTMIRSVSSGAPATAVGTLRQDSTIDLITGPSQYGNISFDNFGTISVLKQKP